MVVVVFELFGKLFEIAVELLGITDGGGCKSVAVELVAVELVDGTLPLGALPPSAMLAGLLGCRFGCRFG